MKDFLTLLPKTILKFLKTKSALVLLALSCFFLLQVAGVLFLGYGILTKLTANLSLQPSEQIQTITPYPQLVTPFVPDITAEAAFIMEKDSKVPLFTKNERMSFPIASTTKIMTALVALETFQLSDVLEVKREKVEGAVMGLTKGEKLTFESLLYGMMLPSGNDAAFAIADNYPGGVTAFVTRMNRKAKELYLRDTFYVDPTGLEEKDVSTAKDLSYLAVAAISHPILREVVQTKEKIVTTVSGDKQFTLENLNILLGEQGVIGLKTGYTLEAGGVLVTVKQEKEKEIIMTVLRSQDRIYDTRLLLSLVNNNIQFFVPQEIVSF